MKKFNIKLMSSAFVAVFMVGFVGLVMKSPIVYAVQATVDLGTATPFAILSGTPLISDSPTSVITGNVGLYPGPGSAIGLLCSQVTGTIYARDATGNICFTVNDPLLLTAKNDLTAAYTDVAGRTPVTIVPDELGGTTLTPGVYASTSTALQITAGAGPLVLDAQNDPSAIFIFEVSKEAPGLTVGPGSVIQLTGQAQACNVFWRVDTATIDTTAVFKGNILALNSITVANGANIEGSLLARNGQVTLINDTITVPICIVPEVVTPTPKLPNTGFSPEKGQSNLWVIGIAAGVMIIASISLFIVRKKRAI